MEFGFIALNTLAFRYSPAPDRTSAKNRITILVLDDDENENANPHRTGSYVNRPSPSTSNSRTVGAGGQSDFRTRSTASLTKSISFETPYGVVRQSSSSTMEPENIHSVTSQESFRREISLYKMQLMPVLAEDGDSSDEDKKGGKRALKGDKVYNRKGRGSQKAKLEMKKNRCTEELEEHDTEQDCFDDITLQITDSDHGIHEHNPDVTRPGRPNLIEWFMKLFSCTQRQDNDPVDLDSEMLIKQENGIECIPLRTFNK